MPSPHFSFILLLFVYFYIGVDCAKSVSTTPPKLRVLIIVPTAPFKLTHYNLHRSLAEILVQDEQNIEYVHLLALTTALWTIKEPWQLSHNARLVVQYDSLFKISDEELEAKRGSAAPPPAFPNVWQERMNFNPNGRAYTKWRDVIENERLIAGLNALKFNVGIVETTNTAGLTVFELLPTIKRTVATSSIVPYINLYEHLGYGGVKFDVPDINNAEIGDHQLVGQSLSTFAAGQLRDKMEERQWKIFVNNVNLLQTRREQDAATWEMYNPIIASRRRNIDPNVQYQQYPALKRLFQRVSFFFSNMQPAVNFLALEKIVNDRSVSAIAQAAKAGGITQVEASKLRKKLRFFGGIQIPTNLAVDEFTNGILENNTSIVGQIKPVDRGTTPTCTVPSQMAYKGTILVIAGTVVKMREMPPMVRQALREAFAEMAPQGYQFIWKARDVEDDGVGSKGVYTCDANMFLNSWVPQPGILAHRNTLLFISHCGNNSVLESAHFGVPLICYPFFGDQYYNAEAMASRGWAKVLDVREQNPIKFKQQLIAAMKEMLAKGKPTIQMKSRDVVANEFLQAIVSLRDEMALPPVPKEQKQRRVPSFMDRLGKKTLRMFERVSKN